MGNKIILVILTVIVALAAIFVSSLFIFKGKKLPLLGRVVTIPFVEKTSAQVIGNMLSRIQGFDSGSLEFVFQTTIKSKSGSETGASLLPTNSDVNLILILNSDFMADKENKPRGKTDFSVSLGFSGMKYNLAIESMMIDDKIYLKASDLPIIPFFDITSYLDQWYLIDTSKLQEDLVKIGLPDDYLEPAGNLNTNLSPEKIEKIKKILKESNLIKIKERLPDERIDRASSYHYSLEFDQENFNKFIISFFQEFEELNTTLKTSNKNISDIEKALDNNELDKIFNAVNQNNIEIWIGKEDYNLNKIYFKGQYQDEQSKTLDYIDFEASLKMSQLTGEIKVEAPEKAKSINELVEEITKQYNQLYTSPITPEVVDEVIDLGLDSDNDGLNDLSEVLYGTDENNPDTDADGFKDGDEVENGYNPLGPGKLDTDNDGLTDMDEEKYGTDKNNPDTDGDGFQDGDEVRNGYNPKGEGRLITL